MKRGYLLPEGCKDLMDAWKHKKSQHLSANIIKPEKLKSILELCKASNPLPQTKREIIIPITITVTQLATLIGQAPAQIIGLMRLMQIEHTLTHTPYHPLDPLDFETISRIARVYGLVAKMAAN